MLGRLYSWFWFHTEWYLTPVNRRPYTFILRDLIYSHITLFWVSLVIWVTGLFFMALWSHLASILTTVATAFLLGHLIWGTPYIIKQQEFPTYLGEED